MAGFPPPTLTEAERLHDGKEWKLVVLMAQTACELVTELAITTLLVIHGVPELTRPIVASFSTYSLRNDRLRMFYEELSREKIDTLCLAG